MYPMNLAVVVLVGEHQHRIVAIISGQPQMKVSYKVRMWHVLVMYPFVSGEPPTTVDSIDCMEVVSYYGSISVYKNYPI